MGWADNSEGMISQLQSGARASGSFVDRAVVRELKLAFARASGTPSATAELVHLAERWEDGMPDLLVLEAIRRINRDASCWKSAATAASSS
jgi:hypothetical protein